MADAAFETDEFIKTATSYAECSVVSQLKSNQLVKYKGNKTSLADLFTEHEDNELTVQLRGEEKSVVYVSRAVKACSHMNKKRKAIAFKYQGEKEFRYIVSNELNWTGQSVIRTYSLRWLVEGFFEDWKANGGWNALTKHQGVLGERRGVTLSLLVTHCRLVHPEQINRLKKTNSLYTEGSIVSIVQTEAFIDFMHEIACLDKKE